MPKSKKATIPDLDSINHYKPQAGNLFYIVQLNQNWVDLRTEPVHRVKTQLEKAKQNLVDALLLENADNITYLQMKVGALEDLYHKRLQSE